MQTAMACIFLIYLGTKELSQRKDELELRSLWSTWERNDVADVLHTRHEEDKTLETEAETSVRARTEATGIEVPPHILHWDVASLNLVEQLIVALLTNRTTDDLTDLRKEDIGTLHGLAILIDLHIEGLDILRIIGHDNGFLEVLLYEETLVLRSEIIAPCAGELEFLAVLDGLLEDIDTFGIGQTNELGVYYTLQTLDQTLVHKLVEELEVIHTMIECPANAELDEVLLEVHEFLLLDEGHFGLNHPELCQVTRGIAVLGAESRTEGIDLTQGHSAELTFQLTGNGEGSLFAKEIIGVVDLTVLVVFEVIQVLGRNLEHLARTFAVRSRDERGMEVEITVLVEIGMDSHSHIMTNTEDGAEGVGTRTKVRDGTEELHTQSFLLQRIFLRISGTVYLEIG